MVLYPSQQWVLSLDVTVSNILEEFQLKDLKIESSYSRLNCFLKHKDSTIIDFEQYGKCLIYVSEIDELKKVAERISSDIEEHFGREL